MNRKCSVCTSFLAALSLLFMAGCSDFLDVPPENNPVVQTFYQSPEAIQQAVNAAYSSLANNALYKIRYFIFKGLTSDDEETPEASKKAISNYIFFADDGTYRDMWASLYQGVYRSNLVLANYAAVAAPDDNGKKKVASAVGEAYFLRALFYWHLVTTWGEVPIIKEPHVGNFPASKSPVADVWAFIEADLTAAIAQLPDKPLDPARACKPAAQALLGKVYLFQNKYAQAAAQFDAVIASKAYALDTLPKIWTIDGETGKENVFVVGFSREGINPAYDDGADDATGTLRNVYLGPSQGGTGYQNTYPSKSLVDEFEPGDPRIQAWMWTTGDPLPDPIQTKYDGAKSKNAYAIRKGLNSGFNDKYRLPGGWGEDFPLIRYADVLLMYAECVAKGAAPGTAGSAQDAVNKVRARAFVGPNGTLPDSLKVEALMTKKSWDIMAAIKHERRIELAFECHRINDLVRWGDAATATGGRYKDNRRYLPIPQVDVDRSGGALKQNPAY